MTLKERYWQVAALHAANINQGFLATLGVPFLALMYRAIDEASGSVLLVEEKDGRIVGFVSGGNGMGRIYRQMLRRPVSLCWALLPALFSRHRVVRILEILRYGKRDQPRVELPSAELLSIAVAQEARGTGVAESLYRRLVGVFADHGVDAFKITVGDALLPAQRFYTRMGAVAAAQIEVHQGERSIVFVHRLAG